MKVNLFPVFIITVLCLHLKLYIEKKEFLNKFFFHNRRWFYMYSLLPVRLYIMKQDLNKYYISKSRIKLVWWKTLMFLMITSGNVYFFGNP